MLNNACKYFNRTWLGCKSNFLSVSLFYLIFCNLRKILDAQEGIEPSSSGYEPDMLPLQTPRKIEASNRTRTYIKDVSLMYSFV